MMKIKILCVGRVKEKYYADAVAEYVKRLSPYAEVAVRELKEEAGEGSAPLKKEAEAIRREARGKLVCLAVEGKKYTSEGFAALVAACRDRGDEVTFVIGGSNGLDGALKAEADALVSISDMTLPHALARVFLAEQLYRAFSILSGGKYHK